MPLGEAALSFFAGQGLDMLAGFVREAAASQVKIEARESYQSLRDHINIVEKWANTVSLISLSRDRALNDCFIELGLSIGLSRIAPGTKKKKSSSRRTVNDVFHTKESLMLLGRPGAGKTTSLQRIAQLVLQEHSEGVGGVPLLVRLRDLRRKEGLVIHMLGELGISVTTPETMPATHRANWELRALKRALERLSAIVLIDGLDEADERLRATVEHDLFKLAESASDYRLVLTCRTAEYRIPLPGVQTYTILPLNQMQVSEFAVKWLGQANGMKFVSAVQTAPYAGTEVVPLMLAHLCILYERDEELPSKPLEVYEQIVSLLIEKWDQQRGVRRRSKYANLNWRGKERFLAAIAFNLTLDGRRGSFHEDDLSRAYKAVSTSFDLPRNEAAEVIEEIESHTGLVHQSGHRQMDWVHLTIQEYLTAMHARGLPEGIKPLIPSFPNEAALVIASSPDCNAYLEKVLAELLAIPASGHASFVPSFLSRLGQERASFQVSPSLGWIFIGFEQLLRMAESTTDHTSVLALAKLIPGEVVRDSIQLAVGPNRTGRTQGDVDVVPASRFNVPPAMWEAIKDRKLPQLGVPAAILKNEARSPSRRRR